MTIATRHERETVWNRIYRFNDRRMSAALSENYPALFAGLQTRMSTFTNVRVNSETHYVVVGTAGRIKQERLFDWILTNCSGMVYYYQMVFWFENVDDALLFKLIISTLV